MLIKLSGHVIELFFFSSISNSGNDYFALENFFVLDRADTHFNIKLIYYVKVYIILVVTKALFGYSIDVLRIPRKPS